LHQGDRPDERNFDAAKQRSDIETVRREEALGVADAAGRPVLTASAYKAVARQGTKIVLLSVVRRV